MVFNDYSIRSTCITVLFDLFIYLFFVCIHVYTVCLELQDQLPVIRAGSSLIVYAKDYLTSLVPNTR